MVALKSASLFCACSIAERPVHSASFTVRVSQRMKRTVVVMCQLGYET